MTKFHRTLRLRLIALSVVVLLGIIAVIHSAVYYKSRTFIENEIVLTAQGIAVAVAGTIMQDIGAYKAFLAFVDEYKASRGYQPWERMDKPMSREHYTKPDCEHSQYYLRMQEYFARIKKYSHVKYIYTERKLNNDWIEFFLDAEPVGDPCHSPPASVQENDKPRREAYSTGLPSRFGLTRYATWGYLLGAYAPILDDDGELLGLVGVNICGSHFHNHLNRLQLTLFVIYAAIVGFILFVLTRFSEALLEPLLKDKLTGAYTKRYAEQLIQSEIAAAIKGHDDLALVVLDLDHFKNINDTYGHNFGDRVLSSVSRTIQSTLRHKDYFIRFGGEEFIALFPKVKEERAMEIAERMRLAVEEGVILNEERDVPVKMTVSIGVTTLKDTAPSAREFVEQADKALYIAKQNRNTVSLYTPETETTIIEKHGHTQSWTLLRDRREGKKKK